MLSTPRPRLITINSISVTAPSPPPSIELTIDHNFGKKSLALGMYLTAMRAMIELGLEGWNDKPIGLEGHRVRDEGQGV